MTLSQRICPFYYTLLLPTSYYFSIHSLVGWALCYGMGYAFDFVATGNGKSGYNESSDNPTLRTKPQYEINSSAAFALLMHRYEHYSLDQSLPCSSFFYFLLFSTFMCDTHTVQPTLITHTNNKPINTTKTHIMGFSVFLMLLTGHILQPPPLPPLITHPITHSNSTAINNTNDTSINTINTIVTIKRSMGFSVFLMLFTGQIRWLALNGIVGLALMWVFNQTGMDNKWVVFSTHSVGYILLAVVIIIMILVFGGVVLVWSHLIEFLKEVLVR